MWHTYTLCGAAKLLSCVQAQTICTEDDLVGFVDILEC